MLHENVSTSVTLPTPGPNVQSPAKETTPPVEIGSTDASDEEKSSSEEYFTHSLPPPPCFFFIDQKDWTKLRKKTTLP
ncbi:unnamed protein product [Pleuronectes platessa]|uniref:Uncharacterized protein n=1 Tax=Pleuronectes platessa TaxID=8262 RepID=A0A9N7Y7T0_PLEPL|nr:unnamed protein product [Pleuronectes platessa]